VGTFTQGVEEDIIKSLQEMIAALEKKKDDMDKEKDKAKKPSPPGETGPPPDQKLLDQIAELKMIRAMQVRLNDRTKVYGDTYGDVLPPDPNLRREVIELRDRQERLFDITNKIQKGDNK
jgi:hypothetical protein